MTAEAVAEKKEINRREFLNFAWLVSLGFITIDLAGVTYLFAMPRFRAGEFGGVIDFGSVGELPPAGSPPVNYPKVKIWLSNTENGVMALYKVCTHLGCLFNWVDQENRFICPCHGSQFHSDGTYIQGPAPRSLDRFTVMIETPDGKTLAQTDPKSGGPVPLPDDTSAVVMVDTGKKIIGQRHG
jgi:cytochrome b6-f complex iron-sulfur subunit